MHRQPSRPHSRQISPACSQRRGLARLLLPQLRCLQLRSSVLLLPLDRRRAWRVCDRLCSGGVGPPPPSLSHPGPTKPACAAMKGPRSFLRPLIGRAGSDLRAAVHPRAVGGGDCGAVLRGRDEAARVVAALSGCCDQGRLTSDIGRHPHCSNEEGVRAFPPRTKQCCKAHLYNTVHTRSQEAMRTDRLR